MIARCTGNLFQSKRHIGLCAKVKLHIGMNREGVEAFLADATPVAVRPHKPFIDGEVGLFTHGALDRIQSLFHFPLRQGNHRDRVAYVANLMARIITGHEMKSQPHHNTSAEYLTRIRVELY